MTVKKRQTDEAARDDEWWKDAASETELFFSDIFIPTDAAPHVRVMKNEPTAVPSQLQTEEEEEMMRKVLRHLNAPQKDDPSGCPIHGWQVVDQSLESQVAQVIAGNIDALGPDPGDGDILANIMNTACAWIPPSPP